MTDAHVYRIAGGEIEDRYLKVGSDGDAAHLKQEVERTQWLASRGIRVPTIIRHFAAPSVFAFMMTAVSGKALEYAISRDNWTRIVPAVARALAALHALPVAACPFDERLSVRLARARDFVGRGMIDPTEFDARNLGMTPEQLYRRLEANIPPGEDCVVTHGDATLANMILGDDGKSASSIAAMPAPPTVTSILPSRRARSRSASAATRARCLRKPTASLRGMRTRPPSTATCTSSFEPRACLGAPAGAGTAAIASTH